MNPKFTKFLEDNPHITLVSMAWSLFWRIYLVICGICIGVAALSALFNQ